MAIGIKTGETSTDKFIVLLGLNYSILLHLFFYFQILKKLLLSYRFHFINLLLDNCNKGQAENLIE
jgi:hypothetical protein